MFITFEGIEGSGKSTQIKKIKDYLDSVNKPAIITREPGGTSTGKILRELILDPKKSFSHAYTELLLFYADRLEHIEEIVKPALNKNHIVLCDRYKDSTYAYQHIGRGIPLDLIHTLNKLVNLEPHLTILLDCDPEIGLTRATKRAELDRFEQENINFHKKIREGFLTLAKQEPKRIKCIDTHNKTIQDIHHSIIETLKKDLT